MTIFKMTHGDLWSKLASLGLAALFLIGMGAINAHATQYEHKPRSYDKPKHPPHEHKPPPHEKNPPPPKESSDGRCDREQGLVIGYEVYCGQRPVATAEYTFAEFWAILTSLAGGSGQSTPPPEPPAVPTKAAVETPPVVSEESQYYVQIAAMCTEDNARKYWDDVRTPLATQLQGLDARFDPVSAVPSNTTFYAVRTGPFEDEILARSWCSDLKRDGTDCFIVHPDKQ
ncbi:MAG: SPOR domain-containing protein [Pseudomonadota bacterium]